MTNEIVDSNDRCARFASHIHFAPERCSVSHLFIISSVIVGLRFPTGQSHLSAMFSPTIELCQMINCDRVTANRIHIQSTVSNLCKRKPSIISDLFLSADGSDYSDERQFDNLNTSPVYSLSRK